MDTGNTKHRLLLVDGDPKSLRVLGVSLKKAGFEVVSATRGGEALAALELEVPDLIISDTDLDEMDGFELCRQIKSRPEWAKIPFLFVSGRKSIEDKIRGLELGVEDYLTKPIYIKEIGIRVRTALQRAERERLESRRDGRTKFAGDLSDIGVVDLVQTIDVNRKSGIVHMVNRDNRRGAIFFRDGNVIDAEVGHLAGADAMYRLFAWSDGHFEVEFKPIRRKDVIDMPSAGLLMEGMRRLDEWTRLLETLPPLDCVPQVDFDVLAEQLAELPDEVNGILRLCDGSRTLMAVLDDTEVPDLEALTAISRLFTERIIFAPPVQGADRAGVDGVLEEWLAEGESEEGGEEQDRPPAEEPSGAQGSGARVLPLSGTGSGARVLPSSGTGSGARVLPSSRTGSGLRTMAAAPLIGAGPSKAAVEADTTDEFSAALPTVVDEPAAPPAAPPAAQSPSGKEGSGTRPRTTASFPLPPLEGSGTRPRTTANFPPPPPPNWGARGDVAAAAGESIESSAVTLENVAGLVPETMTGARPAPAAAQVRPPSPPPPGQEGFGAALEAAASGPDGEPEAKPDTLKGFPVKNVLDEAAKQGSSWQARATAAAMAAAGSGLDLEKDADGEADGAGAKSGAAPRARDAAPARAMSDADRITHEYVQRDLKASPPAPRTPSPGAGGAAPEASGPPSAGGSSSAAAPARTAPPTSPLAPGAAPTESGTAARTETRPSKGEPVRDRPADDEAQTLSSSELEAWPDVPTDAGQPRGKRWIVLGAAALVMGALGFLAVRWGVGSGGSTRTSTGRAAEQASPPPAARVAAPVAALPVPAATPEPRGKEAATQPPGEPAPAHKAALLLAQAGPGPARQAAPAAGEPAPVVAAPEGPDPQTLREACLKADDGGKGRPRAVLKACRTALKSLPEDVDVMVILARAELDRGKPAEARSWAKKAIEMDAERAEAYVFLGGAEQEAGNAAEAKAAYKKYLELAPTGRYARELRAILDNL